jgi:tetratricopeptide (TPR) repeat protein
MIDAGLTQLPNASELYLTRGILYSQLDSYSEAMADFESADRLSGSASYSYLATGIAHSQHHDSQQAIESFRVRVKHHPNDALALYLLADALNEQEPAENSPEFKEAFAAALQSDKLDPSPGPVHDLVAKLYLQLGKTDMALKQSELALQRDPNDQEAIYRLIQIKRKISDRGEVQALVKRLAEVRQAQRAEGEKHRVYVLQDNIKGSAASVPANSAPAK